MSPCPPKMKPVSPSEMEERRCVKTEGYSVIDSCHIIVCYVIILYVLCAHTSCTRVSYSTCKNLTSEPPLLYQGFIWKIVQREGNTNVLVL